MKNLTITELEFIEVILKEKSISLKQLLATAKEHFNGHPDFLKDVTKDNEYLLKLCNSTINKINSI